jgi:hypothetical protein
VLLLAIAAAIGLNSQTFSQRFALAEPPHGAKVTALETQPLENALADLAQPAAWSAHPGSLFVSRKYVTRRDPITGQEYAIDPFDADSQPLHPPIPNSWFLQHGLEDRILDINVPEQDPDKDGFSNMDEFLGGTDPLDPQSHPGYLPKLFLKRFIKVPFRLKFAAYDGDEFQINTVDVRQPTQFVKMDEVVPGTKFKIIKFEKKSISNPSTGDETDVSELTVRHTESGLEIALIVDRITDSPDQYALVSFLWDSTELRVKKDQKFKLGPEPDVEYQLVEIKETEAHIINLKEPGKIIVIPHINTARVPASAEANPAAASATPASQSPQAALTPPASPAPDAALQTPASAETATPAPQTPEAAPTAAPAAPAQETGDKLPPLPPLPPS